MCNCFCLLFIFIANHRGWFEFRLCPNNNVQAPVTQTCLNRYLLTSPDGITSRFPVEFRGTGDVTVYLRLPLGLTCTQCVLQWKYNAGNNWGIDPVTGQGCLGCGPQEQFYACSDVAITFNGNPSPINSQLQSAMHQSSSFIAPNRLLSSFLNRPELARSTGRCRSAGAWEGRADMTVWCQRNCASGFCPETHCTCT